MKLGIVLEIYLQRLALLQLCHCGAKFSFLWRKKMADLSARYRIILKSEYDKRKKRNPRYSKNSFARLTGVDNTYLSKLSKGKILLSLEIADKITKRLKLDTKTRAEFLLSIADEHRCHALYLIDPTLTECDPDMSEINIQPRPRKK